MKQCPRCGKSKAPELFTTSNRSQDGLGTYCRTCRSAMAREDRRERAGRFTAEDVCRFWSRVDKSGEGGCWVWQGASRNHEGYGQFHLGGRNYSPHTIALMLVRGIVVEKPREIFADHICRNRRCVNPDHLRLATPRQNALENNSNPWAINAGKKFCVKGHPLFGENVAWMKRPEWNYPCRQCITCYPSNANSKYRVDPPEGQQESAA